MQFLADFVNFLSAPQYSFTLSIILFLLAMRSRRLWTKAGGVTLLAIGVGYFLLSLINPDFRLIVTKEDNVPIVMMVFLVGYFYWLSMSKAIENDKLTAAGEPTFEKTESEDRIFTWPDLVFSEFICMVLLTVAMVVWSIVLKAPLEEPANPALAPNPSKAPWYFLGLQELLTMFHPMIAGVTIPGVGLIVLIFAPYIDKNPSNKPEDRKFATSLMTIHLMFWAVLVIIGSFFRGPGFNFTLPWKDGLFFEL